MYVYDNYSRGRSLFDRKVCGSQVLTTFQYLFALLPVKMPSCLFLFCALSRAGTQPATQGCRLYDHSSAFSGHWEMKRPCTQRVNKLGGSARDFDSGDTQQQALYTRGATRARIKFPEDTEIHAGKWISQVSALSDGVY